MSGDPLLRARGGVATTTRTPASVEQRRAYQERRRREAGRPTRAEANERMRVAPRLVAPPPVALRDQDPLYAQAIDALGAVVRGTDVVTSEEWIREEGLQDAVLGILEDRRGRHPGPRWLERAKTVEARKRREQRVEVGFPDDRS